MIHFVYFDALLTMRCLRFHEHTIHHAAPVSQIGLLGSKVIMLKTCLSESRETFISNYSYLRHFMKEKKTPSKSVFFVVCIFICHISEVIKLIKEPCT